MTITDMVPHTVGMMIITVMGHGGDMRTDGRGHSPVAAAPVSRRVPAFLVRMVNRVGGLPQGRQAQVGPGGLTTGPEEARRVVPPVALPDRGPEEAGICTFRKRGSSEPLFLWRVASARICR